MYDAVDGTWYNATVNYTAYGNWTRTVTKQVKKKHTQGMNDKIEDSD